MALTKSARRTQLLADLARVDAQLTKLYAAYDEALENVEVESYRFDSGEGQQQAKRRKPGEIQDLIDELEAKRDRIQRKLCQGGGLVNMNLRRKSGYVRGYYGGRG